MVQNTPSQQDVNQQIQARQNLLQAPPVPPIEAARPKPENFDSAEEFASDHEASAEENRSQLNANHFKTRDIPVRSLPTTLTKPPELFQLDASVQRSQSEVLAQQVGSQAKTETPTTALSEDRPTPNSKPAVKTKSPYITPDHVVAGQVIDSVA